MRKKDIVTEDVKIAPEENFPFVDEEPLRADEEETDDIDDFYKPPTVPEDRPIVNVIDRGKKPVAEAVVGDDPITDLPLLIRGSRCRDINSPISRCFAITAAPVPHPMMR